MSISSEFSETENTFNINIINIDGCIGYDCHQDFTSAFKQLTQAAAKKFIIDFIRASYMDIANFEKLFRVK